MIIVLLGYMGSGKSTIGKALASKLNYEFIDLDSFIQNNEEKTIAQLFSSKGEIYFRKKETYYLTKLLADKEDKRIIALGGGTPCYGGNMDILKDATETITFFLKTSINTLTERLFDERAKRPLIAHIQTKEALSEFIAKHLFERNEAYERADFTLKIADISIDEICEQVVAHLF